MSYNERLCKDSSTWQISFFWWINEKIKTYLIFVHMGCSYTNTHRNALLLYRGDLYRSQSLLTGLEFL